MNASFLAGVMSAWVLVQLGLALFFGLAFVLGRREVEYRLFSLLCLSLGVGTAGTALSYAAGDHGAWLRAVGISGTGMIAAAAVNMDFVLRYVRSRRRGLVAGAAYAASALFLIGLWSGYWWRDVPPLAVPVSLFGATATQLAQPPSALGVVFYGFALLLILTSVLLLVRECRRGRTEALGALLGAVVVLGASVHDVMAVLMLVRSPYLLPHAFLCYAFGVALTLLSRYRQTSVQLEAIAADLAARTRELEQSHERLSSMTEELGEQQQLAAVGELAATIAHEVRNPLAVIVNAVAGLRRSTVSEQDRATLLTIVEEEAMRLNRLVTDLLHFARPAAVHYASVSLPELIRSAAEPALADSTLEVRSAADVPLVSADAAQLRQAFERLLRNAALAMPAGGRVEIEIERAELDARPGASIVITDHGPGMDAEVLGRALRPFFTTRPSGTGLGLPLVERTVRAHGGRLVLQSEPGQGTQVSIFLPQSPPPRGSQPPRLERALP